MASAVIHIAVASEVNKKLNRKENELFIGSIAPDISKLVGETKLKTHFLDNIYLELPDLERFLKKYKNHLDDDFVLGYYIHLYTDYLWFKYFLTEIIDDNIITKLNGDKVRCNKTMLLRYIYNDYTNLNIQLIDKYDLDLKIFYEELPEFENIIEEIPMDKLQLVVDKAGTIIMNTKENKELVFNMENIESFITTSTDIIASHLLEILPTK